MRAAASLAALAAGAILTFAVSARVPGINLRLTGLIIMVAGLIALSPPSRVAAWLRDRRPGRGRAGEPAAGPAADPAYPAYLLQDPAVLAAEVLSGGRAAAQPDGIEHDSRDWDRL